MTGNYIQCNVYGVMSPWYCYTHMHTHTTHMHVQTYRHTDKQTNTHTDRYRPHPLLHQDHIQWAQLSSYDDPQLRSIHCWQLQIIQSINCHSMIPGMCPVVEEWWWEDYKECYMYYYKLRTLHIRPQLCIYNDLTNGPQTDGDNRLTGTSTVHCYKR